MRDSVSSDCMGPCPDTLLFTDRDRTLGDTVTLTQWCTLCALNEHKHSTNALRLNSNLDGIKTESPSLTIINLHSVIVWIYLCDCWIYLCASWIYLCACWIYLCEFWIYLCDCLLVFAGVQHPDIPDPVPHRLHCSRNHCVKVYKVSPSLI